MLYVQISVLRENRQEPIVRVLIDKDHFKLPIGLPIETSQKLVEFPGSVKRAYDK